MSTEIKEADTRGRIVAAAERLFHQFGYQKTTVADIAKDIGMSSANVYRFFESKKQMQRIRRTVTHGRGRAGLCRHSS